jgi:RNA polymerase sigma-70 factor (ECF subfamily)
VPPSDADEILVRRFLDGETTAFGTLVERHQTRVYNLCLRVLGDREDAFDAAQETFLSAMRKLGQFRGDAAFTTWLHRVAVNACYDELRKRQRRPMLHVVPDEDAPESREAGPASLDHADEVSGSLDAAAALTQVPEEFRIALVLADVQDLAYEEIARILEVPVGTVKSRVHRGRVALAKAMGVEKVGPSREPARPTPASEEQR